MKRKILLVLSLLFLTLVSISAEDIDAKIIINQSVLNKFLTAIGPMSYGSGFNEKTLGLSMNYSWTVENPAILIHPNQAEFTANVTVSVGPVKKGPLTIINSPVKYPTKAKGIVEIKYDDVQNKISVKVQKVTFEVAIQVLGKNIHITEVDISQYYKPEFEFAGPQPIQKTIEAKMPDGSKRTFNIVSKPKLSLQEGELAVGAGISFEISK